MSLLLGVAALVIAVTGAMLLADNGRVRQAVFGSAALLIGCGAFVWAVLRDAGDRSPPPPPPDAAAVRDADEVFDVKVQADTLEAAPAPAGYSHLIVNAVDLAGHPVDPFSARVACPSGEVVAERLGEGIALAVVPDGCVGDDVRLTVAAPGRTTVVRSLTKARRAVTAVFVDGPPPAPITPP